jgi:hypothetical protein
MIVVAGSLAQKPRHGGHTWVFLQYLLGFRKLGWDVLFLDRLEPGMCKDAAGQPCPVERSVNLRYLVGVMERFGLQGGFAVACEGGSFIGLSRQQVLDRTRGAALLLNVMGFLGDEEILAAARNRVFLDIDPGFGQMWHELGLHDPFRGHDAFVTIGENLGRPECPVPTCGVQWVTTPQPVVLEHWPAAPGIPDGNITSVVSWRGAYGPVEYHGKVYGLRVHEFRNFAPLPRLTGEPFELALDISPAEVKDLELLRANGWSLADPREVAGDPWAYRAFVQGSMAEFMVAKNMYVRSQCGWVSDRSICYLASGRPVLAQDTGIGGLYPTGEGLLTYTTLDEAVSGIEELSGNYDRHARAARAIAEAYFDSNKILGRMLARLGVG